MCLGSTWHIILLLSILMNHVVLFRDKINTLFKILIEHYDLWQVFSYLKFSNLATDWSKSHKIICCHTQTHWITIG